MKIKYMIIGAVTTAAVVVGINKSKEIRRNNDDIQMLKEYLLTHPIDDENVIDAELDK